MSPSSVLRRLSVLKNSFAAMGSRRDVGSSKISSDGATVITEARVRSCFCPPESKMPRSPISVSNCLGSPRTNSSKQALFSAQNLKDNFKIANIYFEFGEFYYDKGNDEKALVNFFSAKIQQILFFLLFLLRNLIILCPKNT